MSPRQQIREILLQHQLLSQPSTEALSPDSPWYVKALLAFSGWLAAVFLLVFLGLAFAPLLENASLCLILGSFTIVIAWWILSLPKSEFYQHLGLAISLAGQGLVAFATFTLTDESPVGSWALLGLLQIILALMMPDFVHRVFSAFFATFALAMTLSLHGIPYIFAGLVMWATAWIWLNEFNFPRWHQRLVSIGYGLTLALIQLKGTALHLHNALYWDDKPGDIANWAPPWIGEVLCAAALLFVVWQLLKRYQVSLGSPQGIGALLGALALGVASLEANGITAGIMLLLLGFSSRHSLLMGLGTLALLFYLSSYYYLLDTTLLQKSFTLVILGALLMICRWGLVHRLNKGASDE